MALSPDIRETLLNQSPNNRYNVSFNGQYHYNLKNDEVVDLMEIAILQFAEEHNNHIREICTSMKQFCIDWYIIFRSENGCELRIDGSEVQI